MRLPSPRRPPIKPPRTCAGAVRNAPHTYTHANMFSPRILAALAVGLTIAAALPTDKPVPSAITTITEDDLNDGAWLTFPLFGNFFAPLWKLFPTFSNAGPKIVADDSKFQVIIGVKDYKKEELKVRVRNHFILLQGSHEANSNSRDIFASQFFQTYSLPENASSTDVTAELSSDGFLIVTAPIKEGSKADTTDREVEIIVTGKPYKEVSTTAVENIDDKIQPESSVVPIAESDDDRKEPTTVSDVNNQSTAATLTDREEATEKDNIIPHGNDIVVP